jgi:hypothetical protein
MDTSKVRTGKILLEVTPLSGESGTGTTNHTTKIGGEPRYQPPHLSLRHFAFFRGHQIPQVIRRIIATNTFLGPPSAHPQADSDRVAATADIRSLECTP